MLKLLGSRFLIGVGGISLVLLLLVLLASAIGGITYDTSQTDRSWQWQININFGKWFAERLEDFQERREEDRPFGRRLLDWMFPPQEVAAPNEAHIKWMAHYYES